MLRVMLETAGFEVIKNVAEKKSEYANARKDRR